MPAQRPHQQCLGKASASYLTTCWRCNAIKCELDHPDGSKRAFFKEFVKVVEAADVIIEVLDARDPLGCRCEDVERFVRRAGAEKRVILLLNKIGPPLLKNLNGFKSSKQS